MPRLRAVLAHRQVLLEAPPTSHPDPVAHQGGEVAQRGPALGIEPAEATVGYGVLRQIGRAESVAGAMPMHRDVVRGHAAPLADVAGALVLDLGAPQQHPHVRRQRRQCRAQHVGLDEGARVGSARRDAGARPHGRFASLAAGDAPIAVPDAGEHVRQRRIRRTAAAAERREQAREHLSGDVVRVGIVAAQRTGEPPCGRRVALVQQPERVFVAVLSHACRGARHQSRIGCPPCPPQPCPTVRETAGCPPLHLPKPRVLNARRPSAARVRAVEHPGRPTS